MKWEDLQTSENVEDRRGEEGGGMFGGPGMGGGGIGLGTMVILGLIGWALGINPALLIGGAEMLGKMRGGGQVVRQDRPHETSRPTDQMGQFVAKVLGSNEEVWSRVLPEQEGVQFKAPRLVLFDGVTDSRCGAAQSAMGPFYCPLDQRIYLDTSFFRDMKQRFGGGGDFAYAYVISHEMGHHIENLLGILPKVQRAQARAGSRAEANNLSVRVELMADCLAGVWANNGNARSRFLEEGDIEKAVASAQAIGDDRLQKAQRGYVVPDSFTHGSSAQRTEWLLRGLKSGRIDDCNTFNR
ncbi:neutral zinc metallopeptidase [Methylocystis sp. JAN1]|uniref:KPN_02809 family neutral zinc metallopeptidase n=1 Tax=Methylocystis sp. JAN1 TaxID=3397211 RepID=UPI003FA257AF